MKYFNLFALMATLLFVTSCDSANSQNSDPSVAKSVTETRAGTTSDPSGGTYLYTYKLTVEGMSGSGGESKIYVSDWGIRSEMNMKMMGQEMNITTLALESNPEQSIVLNENAKTYTIKTAADLAADMSPMAQFEKTTAAVIGQEKIQDYNCTHVVVTTELNIQGAGQIMDQLGNEPTKEHLWLSKEIPGFDRMVKYVEANPKMMNLDLESAQIAQYGMPVKQISQEEGVGDIVNELISVEKVAVSKDKFEIPKNYVEKAR